MRKTRRRATVALLFAATAVVPTSSDGVVHAGSGLNQWAWGGPNITLSTTSYKYSNMSGFWQAVVNSNGCPIVVDGIFGNYTKWFTAVFQNGIFGWNNGGMMTPWWLNHFQTATSVYGPRLYYTGYTDGYATQHYGYYGGFDSPVNLGWNPFSSQWLFAQRPASAPHALTPATPNRTISSAAACS